MSPPSVPDLEGARTAAPLVGRALTVCEGAGLDLFLIALLRDALGVLAEDYLGVPVTDYLDTAPLGPGGGQAGRPPPSSSPSHDDTSEGACSPPTARDRLAHSHAIPSACEWAATVHLLTAPAIAERAGAFVDRDGQEIGWPGLLQACLPWSAAERLLVDAALDLWNGDRSTSLYDAVRRLDDPNFARLHEALRLRRGLPVEGTR